MKVPVVHSYEEAIIVIALLRLVNSKTLTMMFQDQTVRSHFVKKAVAQKHLKKMEIQNQVNGERKSLTLYSITWRGVDYVSRRDGSFYELLNAQGRMALYDTAERKIKNKVKLAAVSNAIVVSYSAGAYIHPESFGSSKSDEDERLEEEEEEEEEDEEENEYKEKRKGKSNYTIRNFYADYLNNETALLDRAFPSQNQQEADEYMVFYDKGVVKSMIAQAAESGDIRDFQSGRFTGMLESHFKTVMMYSTPLYTMPWTRWLVNSELNVYRMWGRTYSITDKELQRKNLTMAAVIVNNAREFAYHYNSNKRKREKGEVFGGTFAHTYIIPNDQTGIRFLNWLMLIDDKEIHDEMLEIALRTGGYKSNSNASAAQFVLRSQAGNETAIILTLDAKQIIPVQYYAQNNKEKQYQVMCFDWQVDYLRRVLPENVKYRPVSFSITQNTHSKN